MRTLCVFVRCVRSHAAGAHEGTVHSSAPALQDAIGTDRIGDAFKSFETLRSLAAAPGR
jgi:hypothetical protein